MRPESNQIGCCPRFRGRLPLAAAALAALLAWIVPPGESPDELAHLRYAETLATGRLPPLAERGAEGYEAHQPPLGYLLPALVLATFGGVDVAPTPNPTFDFHRAGSRAFQPAFASGRDLAVLRLARSTQAIWAGLAVWAGLVLAGYARCAAPYLLAPQLLFVCATLNNDAALIACSTVALLRLARFAESGEGAVASALLVALALFVKGSALFLLVPVAVAAVLAPRPGAERMPRLPPGMLLVLLTAAGVGAWVAFNFVRFGGVLPPVPTAAHVATLAELVREPRWIGGLFRSFWAKFGWLNTPMPWPFYVWFALLAAAAAWGALRARKPSGLVLASAPLANFALVVAYFLVVDFQPQGRYLLPSLAAVATLAGASPLRRIERALEPAALLVALAAVATLALAYR